MRRDVGDGKLLPVAVTCYGAPDDRQRSVEADFDGHFVKPMEISDLEEFLASKQRQ